MPGTTLRVTKTTIAEYVRGQEDLTTQKYGAIRYLRKKGRISFNATSYDKEWVVYYNRNEPVPMDDLEVMTFDRVRRHERAAISYRWQSMNEAISKKEREENKGAEALVKIWENKIKNLTADFTRALDKQFWGDGGAVGNEQELEGLQTVVNDAATSSDQYPTPNSSSTYAGLNTAYEHYGPAGTTETYPEGQIHPAAYFWMPFQTKYTHANFGGSTWEDNCIEALRETATFAHAQRGNDARPAMYWMGPRKWSQFANAQDEKERIPVGSNSEAVQLGFRTISFEGAELVMDFHVPSDGVFGFNPDAVELLSKFGTLFDVEQDKHIEDRTERIGLDFGGNLKLSPRNLVYLGDFA